MRREGTREGGREKGERGREGQRLYLPKGKGSQAPSNPEQEIAPPHPSPSSLPPPSIRAEGTQRHLHLWLGRPCCCWERRSDSPSEAAPMAAPGKAPSGARGAAGGVQGADRLRG